jgi:hypothetical protein
LSPRAKYTFPSDRRLSAKLVTDFVDMWWHVGSVTDTYDRILRFLDRSCYFFFQVALQLYSRRWLAPVPGALLLRKSDSVWKRTRDCWTCSQELWPLDHRGGLTLHIRMRKCCYCLVNLHGIWIAKWIYWNLVSRNYKQLWRVHKSTQSTDRYISTHALLWLYKPLPGKGFKKPFFVIPFYSYLQSVLVHSTNCEETCMYVYSGM